MIRPIYGLIFRLVEAVLSAWEAYRSERDTAQSD